jgi:hypothetical protein
MVLLIIIVTIFSRELKILLKKNIFMGFSSNRQIESKLTHLWRSTSEKRPYHLVRYSLDDIGLFSLCFIDSVGHKIQVVPVRNIGGSLYAEGGTYDTWKHLKKDLKKNHQLGKGGTDSNSFYGYIHLKQEQKKQK